MDSKLTIFLKGFAMGAANVIPGVSGGTVAFLTGIYQRLIDAIQGFDVTLVKLLLKRDIAAAWKRVDGTFLMMLIIGVFLSILSVTNVLERGFESYPVYVAALFFGFIAASIVSVMKMVEQWKLNQVVAILIGLALAVSLVFVPEASESQNFFYLMLCGAVAMCSMIIPGVSGSFVLLLMGNYHLIMIDTVNALRSGQWADVLAVGVPVGLGAVSGLLLLSRVLSWLFRRFHDTAVAAITGFIAGSLLLIWPWKRPAVVVEKDGGEKILSYERFFPEFNAEFWSAMAIMVVAAVCLCLMDKVGVAKRPGSK